MCDTVAYARVEQPFGINPPTIHCPICGHAYLNEDENKVGPCEHLEFIFVGEAGDFEFKSKKFEDKFVYFKIDEEELDEEDSCLSFENIEKFLNESGYDCSMVVIEITYGGMACGPIYMTDIYGFDYKNIVNKS